jgi:hypothetical protein
MVNYLGWAEFGEGRYPDCHYEGRQWPGSLRELVLEGFVDAMYLRELYPVRSIETALSVKDGFSSQSSTNKTCATCVNWIELDAIAYEGVCASTKSIASTADTVEACFTCDHWETGD